MVSKTVAQESIKKAWRLSCYREDMPPDKPHKLPLLFSIDSVLEIPDGFKYSIDCRSLQNKAYCASHIACGGAGCMGWGSGCSGGSCGGGGGCGGS